MRFAIYVPVHASLPSHSLTLLFSFSNFPGPDHGQSSDVVLGLLPQPWWKKYSRRVQSTEGKVSTAPESTDSGTSLLGHILVRP